MLSLTNFRPSTDKVFKTEYHPTQPWVASATKSDYVSVWDWNSNQVIHKAQLGENGEAELYGDSDLGRLHQRDDSVEVNSSLYSPMGSRTGTGKVRDVRFLDADVAATQLAIGHTMINGSASPAPNAAPVAAAMHGQRLLVIVCENKVLVVDLISNGVREISSKTHLDGKDATCCAFLFLSGLKGAPGKGPQVMSNPVLAIGSSDGLTRLFLLSSFACVAVLTSTHKTAITSLLVAPAEGGAAHEVVVGCFASGNMATWEPFLKPLGSGRALAVPCVGDHKMHDKEVSGMVMAVVDESPGNHKVALVTAGADCRVLLSQIPALTEARRHKLDSKAPPTCLVYVPRGFTSANTHCLLFGTDVGFIIALHPTLGSLRVVFNLDSMVSAGTKKHVKVYCIAVHPLQPHLIVLGTNTGMAFTTLDLQTTPSAAPLPLISPGQVLDNRSEGVTFVMAVGDSVHCTTVTTNAEKAKEAQAEAEAAAAVAAALAAEKPTKKKGDDGKKTAAAAASSNPAAVAPAASKAPVDMLLDLLDDTPAPPPLASQVAVTTPPGLDALSGVVGDPNVALKAAKAHNAPDWSKPVSVQVLQTSRISTGWPASRAVLAASHDGSYISVVWPIAKQYAVFYRGVDKWDKVAEGAGSSSAWHACEPTFAVVAYPTASTPAPAPAAGKSKKGFFSSKSSAAKEAEKARMDAAAASQAASFSANGPPVVQVYALSGRNVTLRHSRLRLSPQDLAVAVNGGPLLAVSLQRQLTNSATLYPGLEPPSAMQLYDWGKGDRVGVEVPAPLVLSWDPTLTVVALAYTAQVLLCTTQPSLQMVASLPIDNATGIQWGLRQMYITTPTRIYAAFFTLPSIAEPYPPPINVHTLTLACFGAPLPGVSPSIAAGDLLDAGAAPPPLPRPPGPLALLGPRDGFLWVINVHGQALALPLARHVGVRVMCLAAAGDTRGAVELANQLLPPAHHGMVAELVCSMNPKEGPGQALRLTGLCLATEAHIRIRLHQWPQALEAAEALLHGFSVRPPQGVFTYPVSSAAFNTDSHAFSAHTLDAVSFAPTISATGCAYADDLDWLAPIRSAATNQGTLTALSVAAGSPPATALTTAARQGLSLALDLLSHLRAGGLQDVCRYVVQLLIPFFSALSTSQRSEVITIMAEIGMRQDLPQVVHLLAPGCRGGEDESLGLLAGLLTGHGPLIADVLGHGGVGNAALVAARVAATSKESTRPVGGVAATEWQQALAAAPANQAAPGAEPGVHFKAVPVEA